MNKVQLGMSQKEATRIGLGTWAIGGSGWGGTDKQESIQTIQTALDKGINFIDTAPAYGQGLSEEIIGEAIQQSPVNREDLILATKAGINWNNRGTFRDSRPERLEEELEESFRRLGTDYIDLYQIHWPDDEIDLKETAAQVKEFYDSGKILAVGVSNFTPEQMDEWRKYAPLHTSQMQLNLLQRSLSDWFDYCRERDIVTISWGSLAHGMLTGKYTKETNFPDDDLRSSIELFQGYRYPNYIDAVSELERFANERDRDLVQLSIRWLLDSEPGTDIALWGARKPEQLEGLEGARDWSLTKEELRNIDNLLERHVIDLNQGSLREYGPPMKSEV
ncbi:aldo/keto reductase [Halobacillus salinarum]|uniref:Aldo/keto reductase n=1 Tax=Halobacillus salinarum TaxID=2932257 RepID=A0ABY4EK15_9BACI|nr:aldo/keto reductase [Halobacillus salinarum]UOQ44812.1 aldo/keto reductase [Halobacillus salinarum]